MKVKVQNIIGIGNKGEFDSIPALEAGDSLSRLISHIKNLIDYTKNMHLRVLDPKKNYELITRLTLNEFSLYTHERPLTLSEYKTIISEISAYSKTLPPNIHLILSSLPILWPDGEIHNTVLHVQSSRKHGRNPIIHHLDKKIPDLGDVSYKNEEQPSLLYRESLMDDEAFLDLFLTADKLYQLLDRDDYYHTEYSPNLLLKDTEVRVDDINQHRGALRIKTASGENILVTIEICVEHSETNRIGISDTKYLIQQLTQAGKKVPSIGNHVLTSNSIGVVKENLVARVIHADPKNPPLKYKESARETLPNSSFGSQWSLFTYQPKTLKAIKQKNLERVPEIVDIGDDGVDSFLRP